MAAQRWQRSNGSAVMAAQHCQRSDGREGGSAEMTEKVAAQQRQ